VLHLDVLLVSFQTSVMFDSKAIAYPSGAPTVPNYKYAPALNVNIRLAREQHSSLFWRYVGDEEKKFPTMTPGRWVRQFGAPLVRVRGFERVARSLYLRGFHLHQKSRVQPP
jgi:hypothetical protein